MIGIFFGSFDPPHIGHVNVVTAALNSGKVDNVLVAPAYKNIWKNTTTSFTNRHLMCQQAFEDIPNVVVTAIEKSLAAGLPLPTCKVLEHFKEKYSKFIIITTPETYKEIPQWQYGDYVLSSNKFLVISSSYFDEVDILDKDELIYAPNITICSTNIREKIKDGKIVQPFIQDNVARIISTLKLYK